MTNDEQLYTAIKVLAGVILTMVGWMLVMVRIFYKKFEECDTDRKSLRKETEELRTLYSEKILTLTRESGAKDAQISALQYCPAEVCPMRRKGTSGT